MSELRVLVLGGGRIGLPHAVASAASGNKVFVVDTDKEYVDSLNKGIIPFVDDLWGEFYVLRRKGQIKVALEVPESTDFDFVVVGFGPHSFDETEKWINYVVGTLESYRDSISESIIVFRGTVPIGTTRKIHSVLSEKDWFNGSIYFVPERLVEGKSLLEERTLPVVYGGLEPSDKLEEYFSSISRSGVKFVGTWEYAEAIKLINNAWRAWTFSLSNLIYVYLENAGLDGKKVIEFAGWKYPRGKMPIPGYVSGYCLSKDPEIFAKSVGMDRELFEFLEYGNRLIIEYTLEKIRRLKDGGAKKVLVLGLSYKWDVDDYRSTHTETLIRKLLEVGFDVYVYDPYLGMGRYSRLELLNKEVVEKIEVVSNKKNLFQLCREVDVVVVSTPHSLFRNFVKRCGKKAKIVNIWERQEV